MPRFLALLFLTAWAVQTLAALELAPGLNIDPPAGWTITHRAASFDFLDETSPPDRRSVVTLILRAESVAPSDGASFSFFYAPVLAKARPEREDAGVSGENEKLAQTIVTLGFQPVVTHYIPSSISGRLVTTVETNASGAGGSQIFTSTSLGNDSGSFRLVTSRKASDTKSASDVTAMIASLRIPASKPGGLLGRMGAGASLQPSPSSSPSPQPQSTALDTIGFVSAMHGALVIVEGRGGSGSAFLAEMEGQKYMVTNTHVFENNLNIKLMTLDGNALAPGATQIAVGQDTLRMKIETPVLPFQIMRNLDSGAKIGDPVAVLGNSEGARVVKVLEGKIVGIGPDLVEVDAPFVSGNSGSPIVHVATGKVIGIATYLLERKVSTGSGASTSIVRRFGYRLDHVQGWQNVEWPKFFAQSLQVAKIWQLSEDFVQIAEDGRKLNRFDVSHYKSPALVHVVENFQRKMMGSKMSPSDEAMALKGFFADMRQVSQGDVTSFDMKNSYDYFVRKVEEEARFRTQIYEGFTKMMQRR